MVYYAVMSVTEKYAKVKQVDSKKEIVIKVSFDDGTITFEFPEEILFEHDEEIAELIKYVIKNTKDLAKN